MGILAYQLFNSITDGQLPFPFECNGAIKDKIRRKGGVNYNNYLSYTSKITPFDESVPLDLAELISKMLQNKPENRIQWISFYGCGVLIGTIRIEDCLVLFRSINKLLRQNKEFTRVRTTSDKCIKSTLHL